MSVDWLTQRGNKISEVLDSVYKIDPALICFKLV